MLFSVVSFLFLKVWIKICLSYSADFQLKKVIIEIIFLVGSNIVSVFLLWKFNLCILGYFTNCTFCGDSLEHVTTFAVLHLNKCI